MSRFHRIVSSLVVSALVACGAAAPPTPASVPTPIAAAPAATSAANVEVSALLVDLLAPQLCARLIGSYIGLPGDGAAAGPAAGAEPTVGRWWIRRCQAEARDGTLQLALGGMGWTFVDRESSGFRVRQYLRFDAEAQLNAAMEVGYDSQKKIASLWMRPGDSVSATVTPRGLVSANATSVLSSIAGGLLSITGNSADDHARTQAQEQGSTQLRARLSTGFTLTFDVTRGQLDFMVGALGRGQAPQRAYPSDGTTPWQINQRSRVWPGGLDVVGPIDHSRGTQQIDIELEDGETASVRSVCADELQRYLDAAFQGGQATPPVGREIATLARIGSSARVVLEPGACPLVLLISGARASDVPVRLRYRVGDVIALPTSATAETSNPSTAGASASTTPLPRQVRLQIASISVRAKNGAGNAWDMLGGDADLYVRVTSLGDGREIDRTPTREDSNEASFDHWLPGAFRSEGFPLRIAIYDKDVTTDELIGTVDVPAQVVLGRNSELILEAHTQDDVPIRIGTVRLRVEAIP